MAGEIEQQRPLAVVPQQTDQKKGRSARRGSQEDGGKARRGVQNM